MKQRLILKRSDIKVRKVLPTHLVAQRVIPSRKLYRRRDAKRLDGE